MSQAEELLNGMSEEIPVHTHPVPDTDTYFVIDPVTRKIENTNPKKHVIMQYDHNSERCTFELPRFIDGHDMLECTSVTVNVDNIEVVESEGVEEAEPVEPRINSDAPDMTDLRIHPNDPEKVISSWLISRNSTQLAGILRFHIEYKCVDSDGNVVYEWSTDNYDEIEIRARKKNGEAAVAEHTDLLEQWRTRIFGAGNSVMANIATEGEAQVAAVKAESETQQEAVELKGVQTLDSIPEDYTEVDAMADEAVRSKGDAIVCEVAGESIVLKDSSNDHIRGLKVFGKSKQVATTGANLWNPAEQNSIMEGTVRYSITVEPNTTYTFGTSRDSVNGLYVSVNSDMTDSFAVNYNKKSLTFTTGDTTAIYLQAYSETNAFTGSDVFYFNEGASLVEEPYTGGMPSPNPEYPQEIVSIENPTIRTYGSNMFDIESFIKNAHDKGAQHYVKLADGDLQINTLAYMENYTAFDFGFKPLTPYTLSFKPVWVDRSSDNVQFSIKFIYDDGTESIYSIVYSDGERVRYCKSSGDKNLAYIAIGRWAQNGTCKLLNVYLTEGSFTADDMPSYEPYSGGTLTLDRNFPGIPVTSGGNYTDENGQQWICDEVDLERGVLVKRCDHCVFDGSDDEVWDYEVTKELFKLSYLNLNKEWNVVTNTGRSLMLHYGYDASIWNETVTEYGYCINFDSLFIRHKNIMSLDSFKEHIAANPIELTCVMSEPIEIPLTAEEIAAFKALRTNYPNTTILNDAGAWMSVKYNADTKTYVENPKILKLVDSSTGVVYELKIVNGSLTVNPV